MSKTDNINFNILPDIIYFEEYINYLESLIKNEEKIEKNEFELNIKKSSKKMKREEGILWSSVTLEDIEYHDPSKIFLTLTRKPDSNIPQFQEGQNVKLFKDSSDKVEEVHGIIKNITNESAVVIINGEDVPDFLENGNFSLEISYSDITYKAMYYAINDFKNSEDKVLQKLKKAIFNNITNFTNLNKRKSINNIFLNYSQNIALNGILNSEDIYVVHGPPGTGKTTLILECIKELSNHNEKILLCAPGNYATDLLVERSLFENLNIVRLGNPVRISEKISESTLEKKMINHPLYKDIKSYKREAKELLRQAQVFKRNMNKAIYEERKQKLKESKNLFKLAKKIEEIIIDDIFDRTNILACTLTHLYLNKKLSILNFDTIIIDEASQGLEPLIYLAFLLKPKKRVILVGDPNQLPPFSITQNEHSDLKITLLEKLLIKYKENPDKSYMLDVQYRMNNHIFTFSNTEFYNNLLKGHENILSHTLEFEKINENIQLIFIDTAGTDFYEEINESSSSIFNKGEAGFTISILKKYFSNSQVVNKLCTFGVISPYKAQVSLLKELVSSNELNHETIEINTIDSFQGRESDCIILSLTRSNDNKDVGFLENEKRLNVALSRAKKELIVIGDSETISKSHKLKRLIQYAQKIGGYHSAWEFLE